MQRPVALLSILLLLPSFALEQMHSSRGHPSWALQYSENNGVLTCGWGVLPGTEASSPPQLTFPSPLTSSGHHDDYEPWFSFSHEEYESLRLGASNQPPPEECEFKFDFDSTSLLGKLFDHIGYGHAVVVRERFVRMMSESDMTAPAASLAGLDSLTHEHVSQRFFGCARSVLSARLTRLEGIIQMAEGKGVPRVALDALHQLLAALQSHPLVSSLYAGYASSEVRDSTEQPLSWSLVDGGGIPAMTPRQRASVFLATLISEVDGVSRRTGRCLQVRSEHGADGVGSVSQVVVAPSPSSSSATVDPTVSGALTEVTAYIQGLRTVMADMKERGASGLWDEGEGLPPTAGANPPQIQPYYLPNSADLTSWEHLILTFDGSAKYPSISGPHRQLRLDIEEKLDEVLHSVDSLATSCTCSLQRRGVNMAREALSRNVILRRLLNKRLATLQQYQRVVMDVLAKVNCSTSDSRHPKNTSTGSSQVWFSRVRRSSTTAQGMTLCKRF